MPGNDSPLYLRDDGGRPITLTLQPDATIGTATLMQGVWDPVKQTLLASILEGFDETIACALDPNFWLRVKVAIFELWRLPGKRHDPGRFARLLDAFPNKMLEKAPQTRLSTAQVLAYLDSTDGAFDDLYAWR